MRSFGTHSAENLQPFAIFKISSFLPKKPSFKNNQKLRFEKSCKFRLFLREVCYDLDIKIFELRARHWRQVGHQLAET